LIERIYDGESDRVAQEAAKTRLAINCFIHTLRLPMFAQLRNSATVAGAPNVKIVRPEAGPPFHFPFSHPASL
jgi:hypothetical protein